MQDTEGVENMVQITANAARASVFLLFNLALGAWLWMWGTLPALARRKQRPHARLRPRAVAGQAPAARGRLLGAAARPRAASCCCGFCQPSQA